MVANNKKGKKYTFLVLFSYLLSISPIILTISFLLFGPTAFQTRTDQSSKSAQFVKSPEVSGQVVRLIFLKPPSSI